MNQRNVEALAELLWEMHAGGGFPAMYAEEARWLADHGVLVPSALTWSDWSSVVAGDEGNRDAGVSRLDRIAKGES